ncbi:hypothetical protein [Desulfosporosinus nitroreducens]|uniref:Uncharacterized protein n=1 Tax=Desulfosporosinus nitroreducens TaxID=2018668 RepID=A0ABT8QSY7_9FIRM|nr:hypothetical protein [Desulfosporosinus nitroreducens]MCO1602684.1 hypothetical protein [Desulfosporosinus nitroreducens]MDO0823609.1 hypothetical protein [Desulfosporosinus nitroreducens]
MGAHRNSDNPKYREEAIIAASECLAGRLVAYDKTGKAIEPEYEPSVEILQDPEKEASGPIFVKGNIPIESADGYTYEIRNRVTFCDKPNEYSEGLPHKVRRNRLGEG